MLFIFLHFAISAVGRLDIREISEPLGMTLTMIYGFLPRLLVAAALLAVGVAVGRIGASLARSILAAIGFNSLMVVGHNPGMTDFANFLLPGLTNNLPTAGVVSVQFEGDDWGLYEQPATELIAYDYPKLKR